MSIIFSDSLHLGCFIWVALVRWGQRRRQRGGPLQASCTPAKKGSNQAKINSSHKGEYHSLGCRGVESVLFVSCNALKIFSFLQE